MASNFHKPVQSVISTRKETLTSTSVTSSGAFSFLWTKVDRTNLSAQTTNYTTSFNLPYELANFSSGSSLSTAYPELQHLNTDTFIVGAIHANYYNEMIDGRSLTITVPQSGDTSFTTSAKTVVSSTYHVLQKSEDNALLGKNIAFLFCDDLNLPYTGTTDGGIESRLGVTSWSAASYLDRPAAVSYQNLQASDINSDQRSWASVDTGVAVPETYPTTTNQGLNYDIPVGYVALDKGFIVLTHPTIVDNIPWRLGFIGGLSSQSNLSVSATTNIGFSADSSVSFYNIKKDYLTNVVCAAMPNEFYFTNNPTWDFSGNLSEYQLGSNNFDSTYITEIGLYNNNDELIAITKLDRPKEKSYNNIAMFSLTIEA
jgi:hypothetical protein